VLAIKTWDDYYDTICLKHMSAEDRWRKLLKCVDMSLEKGYHTKSTDFSSIQKNGVSSLLLRGASYPRIVLCIDHSGSMASQFKHPVTGKSVSRLEFVKEVLRDILSNRLTANQQFDIVFFDDQVNHLWPDHQLKQVTPANIKTAIAHCNQQQPAGGTDFNVALNSCFRVPDVRAIYFLSDGETYEGVLHYEALAKRLSQAGKIVCHTTALFAPESGQEILRAIATVTGGTFLNYGEGEVDSH
jgi:hypothetical protein